MGIADNVTSFATTVVRLGRGIYPALTADQRSGPKQLLELYDFEGCPYCRKVREVLCELDLDYLEHPVAHGSPRREKLKTLGGKIQVPYLVDPNTGTKMYESADIMAYLNGTYGAGRRAGWRLPLPDLLDTIGSAAAGAVRGGRGTHCTATKSRRPHQPLTLYNMEGSPYCRKVREVLCELDLGYRVCNVPKGSPKRAALMERAGTVQVPYLIDPNTKREMLESDDIVAYLRRQYGQRQ